MLSPQYKIKVPQHGWRLFTNLFLPPSPTSSPTIPVLPLKSQGHTKLCSFLHIPFCFFSHCSYSLCGIRPHFLYSSCLVLKPNFLLKFLAQKRHITRILLGFHARLDDLPYSSVILCGRSARVDLIFFNCISRYTDLFKDRKYV